MSTRLLAAGVVTLLLVSACAPDDTDDFAPPSTYQPNQNPQTVAQPVATPAPAATPSPAPAPVASPAPVAPAPAPVSSPQAGQETGALNPTQAAPAPVAQPAPAPAATPQGSPTTTTTGGVGTSAPGTGATAGAAFNAGSGVLQPDGKTVVYRIPDGTGGNDWNPKSKPIRVKRGMTLRLIDDDKSTAAGGHYLHTYGQPCPHGSKAIGTGFDCVISQRAPLGLASGVAEHNIFNGIGYLWIEVVEN
jgi:hypothetical protein